MSQNISWLLQIDTVSDTDPLVSHLQAKINQLNDRQLHQLALSLDEMRVGGDGFAVLIVLLLVGILVGVWLHVTGRRVVVE